MKKAAILLASAITTFAAFAQTAEEATPNRILVTNTAGNYTGFVIDYLDQISFARVEGEVLAKVTVNEVGLEEMRLTVTRTPDCNAFKLAVIPTVTANQLRDDVSAIRYINSMPSDMVPVLYEDFSDGTLSGISLNADSDYSLMTIGIDNYGVEAGVYRTDFTTPIPDLVGDPHVDINVTDTTTETFTVSFTPNEDVQDYWILAMEKGQLEQQFEMFAPMFGFSNYATMIKAWGIKYSEADEYTWTGMAPNTEYEIFVAMTDSEGNMAHYESKETATSSLGGHGDAFVDIELTGYELTDWNGEMLPTQYIEFTPNEEASCYRYAVYEAATYDENKEDIKAQLCSDPFFPMAYWFFYEPVSADFQINTSTEAVAIAAAKNIDGVWGVVNEVRFTTAAECDGYVSPAAPARKGIAPRIAPQEKDIFTKGIAPALATPKKKLQLK